MGESDYSFSLTTFSPSGRLVQIEYALNAVTAGATALGIKGEFHGVLYAYILLGALLGFKLCSEVNRII